MAPANFNRNITVNEININLKSNLKESYYFVFGKKRKHRIPKILDFGCG